MVPGEHRDATRGRGRTPAAPGAEDAPAAQLEEPESMLLAWLLVALVNAAFVAATPSVRGLTASARATVHAIAAGQIAGLGLATFVVLYLWRRLVTRRVARVEPFALATASAVLSWCVLRDDLSNFVVGRGGALWQFRLAGAVGYGVGIAGMVAAARWMVRLNARIVPLAAGLALTIANHLVIPLDYDGMHVLAAFAGAASLGAGICGVRAPRGALRRARSVGLVLGGGLSLLAIVVPSPERVWAALSACPGTIVAPFVADLRAGPDDVRAPPGSAAAPSASVTVPRRATAPVPPSGLGLGSEVGTVLFITIDAVRRELFLEDNYRDRFPNLTQLKNEGVFFRNARSPTPATATTYISMMTSQYYSQLYHTTRKSGAFEGAIAPFEDDFVSLPELLRDHAVHTAHASCLHRLVEGATAIGGYDEEVTTPRNFGHAADLTRAIRGILEARVEEERLFLYAHYVDPHAPYNRGGTDGSTFERYLKEIAIVDAEIGALRAWLERTGRWDRTLLVVSADHGEAFGEHDHKYHASTVYDEMVAVPLIMASPHLDHRVVDEPVSLIDLAPTILDWFGIVTPPEFMGQSLVPLMRGEPVELRRPLVIDSGRRIQAMVFPNGMKAIRDLRRRTRELYDLRKDPRETVNLIDSAPDAEKWHARLDAFFEAHTERRPGYRVPWRRF